MRNKFKKICKHEVNENLMRVQTGMELTKPLIQLNRNCEFRKKYNQLTDKDIRKAHQKAYRQRPEVKAHQKAYRQRPEVKAYQKAYYQRPEVKAHKKAYRQRPEVKAHEKAYRQRRKKKGISGDKT